MRRILLIDDEERLSEVVQTCLETLGGWEVLIATTANQGLLIAEIEQPNAILLDVMLPEMDGITLFHHLQEKPDTQSIPVILLSAKILFAEPNQFAHLSVAGVIAKPFDPLKLADQVAKILGWS
ncbi:response regulator receiver protein [Tolypothrix sp. NIES-4075]|uniref:response regulator n=1 Tax=Tolypothrix sp. NIES-4075 TaxID=2005459 RepID=UPI000B6EEB8F|nr:response regulator receiver protein [Tolypothrix sp. NIES-4075]